ncbi:MAG: hypothetical protein WBA22_11365 [Candidatus Methanofastidiosia archaeon]|jgi:hypothetical protein
MNVKLPGKDSREYFLLWVFIVVIGWILWFMFLDNYVMTGGYVFMMIYGLAIGIFSGLPPARAFQVCFFGLLVISLLMAVFGILIYLLISCGITSLFALAGAMGRSIVTKEKIDIDLKMWQWGLLLGGLTTLADITPLGVVQEPIVLSISEYSVRFFLPFVIGLFAASLFTGFFSRMQKSSLLASAAVVISVPHGFFLLYLLNILSGRGEIDVTFYFAFLVMGLFFAAVIVGIFVGCEFRDRTSARDLNRED